MSYNTGSMLKELSAGMKYIKNVFLAGKITGNDWRRDILKQSATLLQSTDNQYPCALHEYAARNGIGEVVAWPVWEKAILGLFHYVGPFYLGCHTARMHGIRCCGCDLDSYNHGCWDTSMRSEIASLCEARIASADLVFAWIDDLTAYATFMEIGIAKALGKEILIAGPGRFDDLDLIYDKSFTCSIGVDPPETELAPLNALIGMLKALFDSGWHPTTVSYDLLTPIESKFLEAWNTVNTRNLWYGMYTGLDGEYLGLFPQYPILKYRVDFAHVKSKTVIELDGLEAHSTTEQIAYDRKRQREIEAKGWKVIRFGGKEIHNQVVVCVSEAREIIKKTLKREHDELVSEDE